MESNKIDEPFFQNSIKEKDSSDSLFIYKNRKNTHNRRYIDKDSQRSISNLNYSEILDTSHRMQYLISFFPNVQFTCLYLLKFSAFEFLVRDMDPSEEEIERFILKFSRINSIEKKLSDDSIPLSPVGLEIEESKKRFTPNIYNAINMVGMDAFLSEENRFLDELSLPFSYSSNVQLRYLQNLVNLNLFKLNKRRIDPSNMTSLHENIGVLKGVTYNDIMIEYRYVVDKLVLLFALAYTSTQRLQNRKTKYSWKLLEDALDSKKTNGMRFEYRVGEFNEYTYRAVPAVQRIMSAFFIYIKKEKGLKLTKKEEAMYKVIKSLIKNIDSVFSVRLQTREKLNLDITFIDGIDAEEMICLVMNDPKANVHKKCYTFAEKYSYRIGKTLFK